MGRGPLGLPGGVGRGAVLRAGSEGRGDGDVGRELVPARGGDAVKICARSVVLFGPGQSMGVCGMRQGSGQLLVDSPWCAHRMFVLDI
jgi:hypothetical protein